MTARITGPAKSDEVAVNADPLRASEVRSTRVLVVEDDPSYREAFEVALRNEGFEVELTANALEGLDRFSSQPPDIVLLDMVLPGMSGIEVCRRVQSISSVPVIMTSAFDTEVDMVHGLELGASDFLTKPYRLRELIARIKAVLRRTPVDWLL
jgi:two-component system response regulator RegX3